LGKPTSIDLTRDTNSKARVLLEPQDAVFSEQVVNDADEEINKLLRLRDVAERAPDSFSDTSNIVRSSMLPASTAPMRLPIESGPISLKPAPRRQRGAPTISARKRRPVPDSQQQASVGSNDTVSSRVHGIGASPLFADDALVEDDVAPREGERRLQQSLKPPNVLMDERDPTCVETSTIGKCDEVLFYFHRKPIFARLRRPKRFEQ
jgi:hypothetical protein